jgi:hypothetical protein
MNAVTAFFKKFLTPLAPSPFFAQSDLAPVWWTELKGEHVFEIHRAVVAQRRV